MPANTLIGISTKWLWEQYGKALTDKALGKLRKEWAKFSWIEAESKYREQLIELYGVARILGFPDAIPLESIFVDVFITDTLPIQRRSLTAKRKRHHALRPLLSHNRVFIVGGPGTGKTTLLKYLVLQACKGKIDKTPIYVSLKEWARLGISLIDFISREFEICGFPNPPSFIQYILQNGKAIVFLDGLDEVTSLDIEDAIQEIVEFEKKYLLAQIVITSRLPVDYTFERFTYFEITKFDDRQVRSFVNKWFTQSVIATRFLDELNQAQNRDIEDLSRTPLFLTFLCLIFQQAHHLPNRKADLVRESIEILMDKWDRSRSIHRANPSLSPEFRLKLIAHLAFQNFIQERTTVHRDLLLQQIGEFLEQQQITSDIDAILNALLSYGILVEEQHNYFAFAHLAIQEYLVAYHLWKTQSDKISDYIQLYAPERRWKDIWLTLASLFDNVDNAKEFYDIFLGTLKQMLPGNETRIISLVEWSNKKAKELGRDDAFTRSFLIYLALAIECARSIQIAKDPTRTVVRAIAYARIRAYALLGQLDETGFCRTEDIDIYIFHQAYDRPTRAEQIAFAELENLESRFGIEVELREIYSKWPLTPGQASLMTRYLMANEVLLQSVSLSTIDDTHIKTRMLLLEAG